MKTPTQAEATIRSVAEAAGVSTATVSRYINKSGYVDEKTGNRIKQAIKETDYTPSIVARSMRSRNSKIVLLIVPDIENPFYSKMAKTAQELVQGHGYVMTLIDTKESVEDKSAILLAKQMYASGIIFASINISDEINRFLARSSIPTVALNAYGDNPQFDTVHVKGYMGTYIATKHLLEIGHTRIFFAGGVPGSMIGKSRREGYERAISEQGFESDPAGIFEQGFSQQDGYDMGNAILGAKRLPTAICCANDQIAFGVIRALCENGTSIPGDVSITGMDDIPYASLAYPSLTTITNDSAMFTREGVRMLFERIEGSYKGQPREVIMQHDLIVRNSTASPHRII